MTTLEEVWANTTTEQSVSDTPAPGTYTVRVSGTNAGVSKKGEQYFLVEITLDDTGQQWVIYQGITKDGVPHAGRVKAAKITLLQLGLEVANPANLSSALATLEGKHLRVEVVASGDIDPVTGQPYLNTDVLGVASASTVGGNVPTAHPGSSVADNRYNRAVFPEVGAGKTAVFPAAVAGTGDTVVPRTESSPF